MLDASDLVVLDRGGSSGSGLTWRVYRPGSGKLVHVLAARPQFAWPTGARRRSARPPSAFPAARNVFVQLEPPGLVYAYDVRGPLQGRVRFIPFRSLRFGRS